MATSSATIDVSDLYARESAPLLAYARARLSGTGIEPEDLVQDSFLALVTNSSGKKIRNSGGYLRSILDNLISDALQERYRNKKYVENSPDEAYYPSVPDPSVGHEVMEKYRLLNQSLAALSNPRQKRVLTLEAQGLTRSQIVELEKSRGPSITAHQISCVLTRARRGLLVEYRRRGGWRGLATLPGAWWKMKRDRVATSKGAINLALDLSPLVQLIVAAALTASSLIPAMGGTHADSPGFISNKPALQRELAGTEVGSAAEAGPQRFALDSDASTASSPDGFYIDLGERGIAREPSDEENEAPPPLQNQILDALTNPEKLLPSCGGLPGCSGS